MAALKRQPATGNHESGTRNEERISIIIPIIRPDKARACIRSINEHAGIPREQYEIVTLEDKDRIGCPQMVEKLVARAQHDLICFMGDDTLMEPGCLKNALSAMASLPDGWGMVAFNDHAPKHRRDSGSHFLADRRVLDLTGGKLFHTGYRHCYCDNELADICRQHHRYVFCGDAGIYHDHPINGRPTDDDYERIYQPRNTIADYRLYLTRKIEQGRARLAIGLPLVESLVPIQFMLSFTIMEKPAEFTLLVPTFPVGSFAGNIADARNSLVTQALDEHCTHLMMMDTDQIYPPDTCKKLLSHNAPVVGTPVHRRWPPFDPILLRGKPGRYVHVPEAECYSGDLVPVDATGCGCILYDLRVFMDLERPWFEVGKTDDGQTLGEDLGLCHKLREKNVPIFVDTSIRIGHLTTMQITAEFYQLFKKVNRFQYREAPEQTRRAA